MPDPTDPASPAPDPDASPAADAAAEPADADGEASFGADSTDADEPGAPEAGASDPASELERGVESFARVVGGVAGKLLGPKAVGRKGLPEGPVISPEADRAIEEAGVTMGRFLYAAGEALKEHPFAPGEAVRTAQAKVDETPPTPEGWSPLVGGMRSLGGGLFRVAEGVLDQVAPRKKRPADDPEAGE